MIKAIIFDCFGVLVNDTWRELLSTIPSPEKVQKAKELNRDLDAGRIGYKEFIDSIEEITGAPRPVLEKIFTDPDSDKNHLLFEYIKQLKKDFKIGILSNVNRNWIRESFLTKQEQKLFDSYTLSYEIGYTKPDPRIFAAALSSLGVRAAEAVFIDDNSVHVQAASDLGLRGIVYMDFPRMKSELEKLLASGADN